MWSICGTHDMGWKEREVFGKIRFMNYKGCLRKFKVAQFEARYVAASQQVLRRRCFGGPVGVVCLRACVSGGGAEARAWLCPRRRAEGGGRRAAGGGRRRSSSKVALVRCVPCRCRYVGSASKGNEPRQGTLTSMLKAGNAHPLKKAKTGASASIKKEPAKSTAKKAGNSFAKLFSERKPKGGSASKKKIKNEGLATRSGGGGGSSGSNQKRKRAA